MNGRILLYRRTLVLIMLSVFLLGLAAVATARIRIASVREYEMRRHINYGASWRSQADDIYLALYEALDDVAQRGVVFWGEKGRMERASLVKVKVRPASKAIAQAFGAEAVVPVKGVVSPEGESGWYEISYDLPGLTGSPVVVLEVLGDGSQYQMVTHVALKRRGDLRRLPLYYKHGPAYAIGQTYFSYHQERGDLAEWLDQLMRPLDGVAVLVVETDNRRRYQEWFGATEKIHWDRVYIRLVLDEEYRKGEKDYEVVLGWKRRKLALGGGPYPPRRQFRR